MFVLSVDGNTVATSSNIVPIQNPTLNKVIGLWELVRKGAIDPYNPQRAAMRYTNRGEVRSTVGKYIGKHPKLWPISLHSLGLCFDGRTAEVPGTKPCSAN